MFTLSVPTPRPRGEPSVTCLFYPRESRGALGSRALSHDSIFIPESGQDPTRPVRVFSQENVCDRIKALQVNLPLALTPGVYVGYGWGSPPVISAGLAWCLFSSKCTHVTALPRLAQFVTAGPCHLLSDSHSSSQ